MILVTDFVFFAFRPSDDIIEQEIDKSGLKEVRNDIYYSFITSKKGIKLYKHTLDVFFYTCRILDWLKNDYPKLFSSIFVYKDEIKIGALLHDIGKTRKANNDNHNENGAVWARNYVINKIDKNVDPFLIEDIVYYHNEDTSFLNHEKPYITAVLIVKLADKLAKIEKKESISSVRNRIVKITRTEYQGHSKTRKKLELIALQIADKYKKNILRRIIFDLCNAFSMK